MAAPEPRRQPRTDRIDIAKLNDPQARSAYTVRLPETANDAPADWQNAILHAAKDTLGLVQRGPTNPWISDDTWQLVQQRRELKLKKLEDNSIETAAQYDRSDHRAYMNRFAAEAEAAAGRFDMKCLYMKVKCIANKKDPQNQPVRDRDGNRIKRSVTIHHAISGKPSGEEELLDVRQTRRLFTPYSSR